MSIQEQLQEQRRRLQANTYGIVGLIASLCTITGFAYYLHDRYAGEHLTIEQRYQQAQQHYNEHNRPQALTEAEQIVQEQPTHKASHELIASCYLEDGNFSGAATECQEAIKIDADDMVAHMGLATALMKEGDKAKAKEAYRFILNHPRSSESQRSEARTYLAALGQ